MLETLILTFIKNIDNKSKDYDKAIEETEKIQKVVLVLTFILSMIFLKISLITRFLILFLIVAIGTTSKLINKITKYREVYLYYNLSFQEKCRNMFNNKALNKKDYIMFFRSFEKYKKELKNRHIETEELKAYIELVLRSDYNLKTKEDILNDTYYKLEDKKEIKKKKEKEIIRNYHKNNIYKYIVMEGKASKDVNDFIDNDLTFWIDNNLFTNEELINMYTSNSKTNIKKVIENSKAYTEIKDDIDFFIK